MVGRRLSEVSQQSGFLPDAELTSMHGSDSTATVLQTDPDGLTLVLGLFSAKQETPIHDHNSWGIACVVRGTIATDSGSWVRAADYASCTRRS